MNIDLLTRRAFGRAAAATWVAVQSGASPVDAKTSAARERDWSHHFPALKQQVNGHRLAYLDSAATTQRSEAVINAVTEFYRHDNANPGAALHTLARRAYEQYESARSSVASFINAAHADEVVWVRGTTEGNNLVATAWARSVLKRGDEILLTLAEHASNLLPWQLAAAQTGATVRYVDVDEAGRIVLDDLDRKLSEHTRLLAFSHVSNVVGYVNPAAEICSRAKRAGARVLIDAAQSAPHLPLDVQALGCDFLTFSSHKMTGPMGIGVLWAHRDVLEQMPPYQAGSNMAHEIDVDGYQLEHAARKFGAGTPNVSGPVGLATAIDYLKTLGREAIAQHEQELTAYALAQLSTIRGLRLLGPNTAALRVPVFSFTLEGFSPQQVLQGLDALGIAVRAGDLAALPLLKHFGVTSAVRASCYLYTRAEDIDALVRGLQLLQRSSTAK